MSSRPPAEALLAPPAPKQLLPTMPNRASVAQMVEHDHEVLHQTLHELADYLAAPPPEEGFSAWKLDLLWQLRDFQNSLQKHFDLEEEGAYKVELLRLAPQFAGQIDHLEEEHRKIILDMTHILDTVKGIYTPDNPVMDRVRERFRKVVECLEEHESQERTLIQDVFYQDYGVGD